MRVDAIHGRDQEFFVDGTGVRRSFVPYLFGMHSDFWDDFRSIQFVQQREGALLVRIVPTDANSLLRVEAVLKARFVDVHLIFESVTGIETTAAGKHRYFVSEI